MEKDLEYYLNNQRSNCCIPKEESKCLVKQKYLSEFSTDEEKAVARFNLGVTEKLDELKNLLDTKVISRGDVAWDLTPTPGHSNYVLSSDALYKEFLKYALKEDVENDMQELWQNLSTKVNYFTSFVDELNQKFAEVQQNWYEAIRCMIRDAMIPYYHKYHKLKQEFDALKKQFDSYIQTAECGVVIADKFGNNENVTVSQKVLTDAINQIYDKLADLTGIPNEKVTITITPDYFITEDSCDVVITVSTVSDVFEHIKIYANNELIIDKENVTNYVHNYSIDSTTTFKVEATILGKTYMEEKTVNLYYPFFIGSGFIVDDILKPENAIPYDGNIEGRYSVTVEHDGEKFFIVIPKSRRTDVGRIHMNGYDIPFDVREEDEYLIYISKNIYRQGTYTVYIQNVQNSFI